MMFSEWFDVYNEEHMRAFAEYRTTGQWPTGFVPEQYSETCHLEVAHILASMALAWLESGNWMNASSKAQWLKGTSK